MLTTQERVSIGVLAFVPFCYIIGSSYVGLNGHHVWRQSDAYAQILGFMGLKGLHPFQDFFGKTAVYDMPLYQLIVARAALLLQADPLVVVKYLNALFLAITGYSGWIIAEAQRRRSGQIFLFFLATSPLLLHYFSTPIPDPMVIALCISATAVLLVLAPRPKRTIIAASLIGCGAFLKSPIAFVFIIFLAAHRAASLAFDRSGRLRNTGLADLATVASIALISAVSAELIRGRILGAGFGFAQEPQWYFGDPYLRVAPGFWLTLIQRVGAAAPWCTGYVGIGAVLLIFFSRSRPDKIVSFAVLAGFMSGWMVFANLFLIHDYYQLGVSTILFLGFSTSISALISSAWSRLALSREIARTARNSAAMVLALAAGISVVSMQGSSEFKRASLFDALEFALRDAPAFLHVDDAAAPLDPEIGGLVRTPLRRVRTEDLESNCSLYVQTYFAIVVHGISTCLLKHRSVASWYVEDDGYQFFRK